MDIFVSTMLPSTPAIIMVMVFSPQSSAVAYVPFKWVELLDNWGVRLGSLGWRLGLGRWLRLLGAGPEQAACYCAATHHTPPWARARGHER